MIRPALALALLLHSAPAAADWPLMPIRLSDPPLTEAQVLERCIGFVAALDIRSTILKFNPITGHTPELAGPFEWLRTLTHKTPTDQVFVWTKRYMDTFGPVSFPSFVPERLLYQEDRATCEPLLSKQPG